eukprot:TRINITY_DN1587_c0_g1_i5.p1 TRINITY_DN1587_c0_g1~~TRINITY_DN1587_c0_g1_i5.p1  ORF type:complete len:126 (+),score=43.09 TRINITY_DN1587_c0_g1_i5:160-537(+)
MCIRDRHWVTCLLAVGELGADGLGAGRAVNLLGLGGADLLDLGELATDDGAGNAGDLSATGTDDAVVGGLTVDTTVGLGPLVEAGVLLAHVHGEGLGAAEGKHGLGGQEREGLSLIHISEPTRPY